MMKIRICCFILLGIVAAAGYADDPIARRAAFRRELARNHEQAVRNGLTDRDPAIRQRALYEYTCRHGADSLAQLRKMTGDPDLPVISTLVACMEQYTPEARTEILASILEKAKTPEIRQFASARSFSFHRQTARLSERPDWDHEVVTVKSVPLPEQGWRFALDHTDNGHVRNFFIAVYNDSNWRSISIGDWKKQGCPDYDGIAWYRLEFTMPARIDCNAVELAFGAVDEAAWVWLNGKYVGQHDIGPSGWNKPFAIDVTGEIKWDGKNSLAVRVRSTAGAGGIWKPVTVDMLK